MISNGGLHFAKGVTGGPCYENPGSASRGDAEEYGWGPLQATAVPIGESAEPRVWPAEYIVPCLSVPCVARVGLSSPVLASWD